MDGTGERSNPVTRGGGTIAMPAQRLVAAPHRPTATRSKGLEAVSLPIVVASTA